ncbi:MAG: dihydroneopterin aldolase, partial [Lachnospiraceae bacterium]|nr:dihydroneopterin aldolase [Lachnospiraceae bacterium]
MDEIRIEDLKIYAYHGVYAQENETGQDFYVNAVLYT